ncbi:MAG: outer membrane lipoprotein-sorting protein [Bryobacteraceae bacterium]|jgi:hypothetical protein
MLVPRELPSAPELVNRVLELRRGASIRARGRMTYTDAGEHRKVFQISVLQKRLGEKVNLLWSVTDPPEARMRILAEIPLQGEPAVWFASAAKGEPVALPPQRWSAPILGSHLTIEDLVDDYFSWPSQVVTAEEPAGGKMSYVIRSEPAAQRFSSFASIVSGLDEETLVPMRILKHPRGAGAPKEIVCRGVRQSGRQWIASNIEVRIPGSPGSTRIVFTGGTETARIRDSEVDPKVVFGAGADGR